MDRRQSEWLAAREDPLREMLLPATADLPERMWQVAPAPTGPPACDPDLIERMAAALALPTDARFEHPLLERAVRVGLAHIDATFEGDHPKYGTGGYAQVENDAFPPTIIATVDALTVWDRVEAAERRLGYWLRTFVRPDGTADYYGPSLAEYGMLLTTARRLMSRGGSPSWLSTHAGTLQRIAQQLIDRLHEHGEPGLAVGIPEADERAKPATYLHNNAWTARGLADWAALCDGVRRETQLARRLNDTAQQLAALVTAAADELWPAPGTDWWLPPAPEYAARPECITATRDSSYASYRYWPELLSSGVLPAARMTQIVETRLSAGGQFAGTTRFMEQLDDWPLMEYLDGLWQLGRRDDYLLSLWGHICFHQAAEHLTAYEQVTLPPGRPAADYCLPSQLVAVRAAARLVRPVQGGRPVI